MNKTLKITLIVLGVLAGTAFLIGTGFAIGRSAGFFRTGALPGGMMRGETSWNIPDNRGQRSFGSGMFDRQPGVFGQKKYPQNRVSGCSSGIACGAPGITDNNTAEPLSVDTARSAAETYVAGINNPDLAIYEIMIFNNNSYVVVKEQSTGKGAFELLIDSGTTRAFLEYGPTRMWNTKYGMMGGRGGQMMGWQNPVQQDGTSQNAIDAATAVSLAQEYLDENMAGAVAHAEPIEFYGYYTLDYDINGQPVGMLSVNALTGQVWPHTWHGTFITEWEAD